MKFFRKPPLFTVRRRFAWWPRKLLEIREKWFAIGAEQVFYEPGWHQNYGAPVGYTALASRYGRNKPARPPVPTNLGRVTPVEFKPVNWFDHWIWLEHYLEFYDSSTSYPGAPTDSLWRHFVMPEQWNLWHEYD